MFILSILFTLFIVAILWLTYENVPKSQTPILSFLYHFFDSLVKMFFSVVIIFMICTLTLAFVSFIVGETSQGSIISRLSFDSVPKKTIRQYIAFNLLNFLIVLLIQTICFFKLDWNKQQKSSFTVKSLQWILFWALFMFVLVVFKYMTIEQLSFLIGLICLIQICLSLVINLEKTIVVILSKASNWFLSQNENSNKNNKKGE